MSVQPPVWVILFIYKLVNHCFVEYREVWCHLTNLMHSLKWVKILRSSESLPQISVWWFLNCVESFEHLQIFWEHHIVWFGISIIQCDARRLTLCLCRFGWVFPITKLIRLGCSPFYCNQREFYLKMANIQNYIIHFGLFIS